MESVWSFMIESIWGRTEVAISSSEVQDAGG